jgi:general secretion pathway protein B
MSLILDALRRMEQERATRRQGTAGIRPEVLRYRGRPQQPSRKPFAWVAFGLCLLAAGIGAALFLREERSLPAPPPQAKASALPEARPALPPPAAPAAPIPPAAAAPLRVAPSVTQPPPAPARKVQAEEPPAAVPEPADKSGITISGIAWQDERRLRRAVINGALVGEGAEVAGAVVVEIKENRVLFWRNDQPFEVVYSSAFTPR